MELCGGSIWGRMSLCSKMVSCVRWPPPWSLQFSTDFQVEAVCFGLVFTDRWCCLFLMFIPWMRTRYIPMKAVQCSRDFHRREANLWFSPPLTWRGRKLFNPAALLDFPNFISPNRSNSDSKTSYFATLQKNYPPFIATSFTLWSICLLCQIGFKCMAQAPGGLVHSVSTKSLTSLMLPKFHTQVMWSAKLIWFHTEYRTRGQLTVLEQPHLGKRCTLSHCLPLIWREIQTYF